MKAAFYTGAAGLRAQQAALDNIGNNIANVNTYGYKAQRAVFSDIYYQTLHGASSGNSGRGGTNPSSVGYGSTLTAVQSQMTQSSMQNTGFGLDVAITGEGFFQVMDPDGNIFYTKAGLLDYDANGYLVDINGNFVLGSTSVDGRPGTQKIRLDNIGSVSASRPTSVEEINGIEYTITSSNASKYGNVALNISSDENLPAGLKAAATIASNGAVNVRLNAFETFGSMTELNNAVNAAIREANGGKDLAAGIFTISANKNVFGKSAVNGTFTGAAFANKASLTAGDDFFQGLGIKDYKLKSNPADAQYGFEITYNSTNTPPYEITTTIGTDTYKATFAGTIAQNGTIQMKGPDGSYINLEVKDKTKFNTVLAGASSSADKKATAKAEGTMPKYFLGGAKITSVSNNLSANGAIDFTIGEAADTNMYEITATVGTKVYKGQVSKANGGTVILKTDGDQAVDGTITMSIPSKNTMLTNLGIESSATDVDTKLLNALKSTVGYHDYKAVPFQSAVTEPLTGAEIAGGDFGITSGKVEGMEKAFGGIMSFMKTSNDFTGSGNVTDFKAVYHESAAGDYWTVTMNIGGVDYSADIDENTTASSLLMKNASGAYIQVSNPGFKSMSEAFANQNPGVDPADGKEVLALDGGNSLDVTPATESRDLGFSTRGFTLTGGTEGGSITLDELSSVTIGADGTVSVSHPEKGTVVAGKISLANFSNPSGLLLNGSNYYSATVNSGDPKLCDPGSSGSGALKSSALEMSNVDLSNEFAEMITTQRGFQANSRIITVSDTMLEELINLKR